MRKSGRVSLWRTRSHSRSSGTSSQTDTPRAAIAARLRSAMKAPPPVDRTADAPDSSRAITSASRSRKKASPSRAKISAMLACAASSIAASLSRKPTPSRAARALPTAVLPDPIMPTSTTDRARRHSAPPAPAVPPCALSFFCILSRTPRGIFPADPPDGVNFLETPYINPAQDSPATAGRSQRQQAGTGKRSGRRCGG